MVEIYDDHIQAERVRDWLKENGGAIVMGIVLALGGVYGWRYWDNYQDQVKVDAAAEYYSLNLQLNDNKLDSAVEYYEVLKDKHGKSPYAGLAALSIAKARLDGGQTDVAETELRYAMDNGTPEMVKLVARQRLARLLLSQNRPDEALALLEAVNDAPGFEAPFAEIRGDILLLQGKPAEAREAYQLALDSMQASSGDRSLLQLKLDDLPAAEQES